MRRTALAQYSLICTFAALACQPKAPSQDSKAASTTEKTSSVSAETSQSSANQTEKTLTSSTPLSCGDIFCEDFEEGSKLSKYLTASQGGTVQLANNFSHRGQGAAHIQVPAGDGYKSVGLRINSIPTLPTKSNHIWGRSMVYFKDLPLTEDPAIHWTVVEGKGLINGGTAKEYSAAYRYGGQHPIKKDGKVIASQWMANYETPSSYSDAKDPKSDCWKHSDKRAVPQNRWFCLEFEFDGPTNSMKMWIDGELAQDLHIEAKGEGCIYQPADYQWQAPSFDEFFFGWESYQLDAPREMWLDSISLGNSRIGCE